VRTVLVVDDDVDIREAVQFVLEDAGYEVVCAGNGREALSALQDGLRPSLIVLDLMMPVMSGWEFREHVLRDPSLRAIPVVVVTGDPTAMHRADDLAAAAILCKPFDVSALIEVVGRFANAGGRSDGAGAVAAR